MNHSPVKHVLQYVDGHDNARVPPTVQRIDGEVGREEVCGLLCICCCTGSTTTTDTNKENVEIMRNKKQKQKNLISQREKIKEEEKEENWKILLQEAQKTIII